MTWIRTAVVIVVLITGGTGAVAYDVTILDLGRGPVSAYVPDSYSSDTPVPLLMLLHGYGTSGESLERYMRFLPRVDQDDFIYLHPNGTVDGRGARFWNATPACCDSGETQTDDSGYLRALINELTTIFSIDPDMVFIVGYSNGGFMAYRMACEHSDVVKGIASLAGATFLDPDACRPERPVHVVHMHGTMDNSVLYDGGCFAGDRCYPGAEASVEQWVAYNRCLTTSDETSPPLDLDGGIPGAETTVRRYRAGCSAGGSCELWTINDGTHIPALNSEFSRTVIDHFFSLEEPKPSRRRQRARRAQRQPLR
jgi:polyhydroxybutyrate depolymerase